MAISIDEALKGKQEGDATPQQEPETTNLERPKITSNDSINRTLTKLQNGISDFLNRYNKIVVTFTKHSVSVIYKQDSLILTIEKILIKTKTAFKALADRYRKLDARVRGIEQVKAPPVVALPAPPPKPKPALKKAAIVAGIATAALAATTLFKQKKPAQPTTPAPEAEKITKEKEISEVVDHATLESNGDILLEAIYDIMIGGKKISFKAEEILLDSSDITFAVEAVIEKVTWDAAVVATKKLEDTPPPQTAEIPPPVIIPESRDNSSSGSGGTTSWQQGTDAATSPGTGPNPVPTMPAKVPSIPDAKPITPPTPKPITPPTPTPETKTWNEGVDAVKTLETTPVPTGGAPLEAEPGPSRTTWEEGKAAADRLGEGPNPTPTMPSYIPDIPGVPSVPPATGVAKPTPIRSNDVATGKPGSEKTLDTASGKPGMPQTLDIASGKPGSEKTLDIASGKPGSADATIVSTPQFFQQQQAAPEFKVEVGGMGASVQDSPGVFGSGMFGNYGKQAADKMMEKMSPAQQSKMPQDVREHVQAAQAGTGKFDLNLVMRKMGPLMTRAELEDTKKGMTEGGITLREPPGWKTPDEQTPSGAAATPVEKVTPSEATPQTPDATPQEAPSEPASIDPSVAETGTPATTTSESQPPAEAPPPPPPAAPSQAAGPATSDPEREHAQPNSGSYGGGKASKDHNGGICII